MDDKVPWKNSNTKRKPTEGASKDEYDKNCLSSHGSE